MREAPQHRTLPRAGCPREPAPSGRGPRYSMPSSIRATCPRLSRHHHDLAHLYRHEYGQLAVKEFGLRASMVERKNDSLSRSCGARYDLATPGSHRVCPPNSHLAQIRIDYRDRREMFFAEAPSFATVMADLRELEDRVNRQTHWGSLPHRSSERRDACRSSNSSRAMSILSSFHQTSARTSP
jgi:hypothetical protein